MGLDVHVASFRRFMTGNALGPVEQVLSPAAARQMVRIGNPKPSAPLRKVREHVALIRRKLKNPAASWDEDSDFHYTTQFDYRAFVTLRAFAASIDFPDIEPPKQAPDQLVSGKSLGYVQGEIRYSILMRGRPPYPQRRVKTGEVRPFTEEEDPIFHRSLVRICEKGGTSFPHLIFHGDAQGAWIPVPFRKPLTLSRSRGYVVGSSIGLLEELNRLAGLLGMKRDWAQQRSGTAAAKENDPLGTVKYGWAVLRACARLSVQHRVPIIFDG